MSELSESEYHERLFDECRRYPGPWQGEPDREEWRSKDGLPCLIRRGGLYFWCGYVAVPPGHPWHGKYEELSVDVHGGLTYAHACAGDICHVPRPGEPDDVWWLGFDTGHAGDLAPATMVHMDVLAEHLDMAGEPEKADDARRLQRDRRRHQHAFHEVYRDVAYVKAQCELLAAQVAQAGVK